MDEEKYRKELREEIQNRIDEEVVIEVLKRVQRAKFSTGVIVKGYGTEMARRIISREHEIAYTESRINHLKSEKRLIKMLSGRPIPVEGQPILLKRLKEKDEEIKKAKERLDELMKQKEAEGLANVSIMAGLVEL